MYEYSEGCFVEFSAILCTSKFVPGFGGEPVKEWVEWEGNGARRRADSVGDRVG